MVPSPALGTQVSTGEVALPSTDRGALREKRWPGSDPRGWGAGGSVAVGSGGVGFRRVTAAAGWSEGWPPRKSHFPKKLG